MHHRAISSDRPSRKQIDALIRSGAFSDAASTISVSMYPGATVFTEIRIPASSTCPAPDR
jgi:hypothetical protein